MEFDPRELRYPSCELSQTRLPVRIHSTSRLATPISFRFGPLSLAELAGWLAS